MGVRYPSVQSNTIVAQLPASAVETVVVTTPPLTLPLDSAVVLILVYIAVTPGTGTTSLGFRIRRGTTTAGVLVNVAMNTLPSAGIGGFVNAWYFDTPGAVTGQQYSATLAQNAGTGAGTITDVAMLAFAL